MVDVTLQPVSPTSRGSWDRLGGSSDWGVLATENDSTAWSGSTDSQGVRSGDIQFGSDPLVSNTLPEAGARVRRMTLRTRLRRPRVTALEFPSYAYTSLVTPDISQFGEGEHVQQPDTASPPWVTLVREWSPQSAAEANPLHPSWLPGLGLGVRRRGHLRGSAFDGGTWQDGGCSWCEMVVTLDEVPTLSSLSPSGTVATSRPQLSYTYADDFEDQYSRRDVIYEGTVGSGPTAEALPDGDVAYDSGVVVTGDHSRVGPALPNGTYTRYVQATQQFGIQSAAPTSMWHRQVFTIDADVPAAPNLTVDPQPELGRVEMSVSDGGGPVAPDWIDVEFRDGESGPWSPFRGGTDLPLTPSTLHDVEAPFGQVRQYRARAWSESSEGIVYTSDPTVVSVTLDAEGRWLTDPTDPAALNLRIQTAAMAATWHGRDVVHMPAGMDVAVVESEPIVQHRELALWSLDPAEEVVLTAALRSRRTLLLRSAGGDHLYFRWFGDRTRGQLGPEAAGVNRHAGTLVEVARPADV